MRHLSDVRWGVIGCGNVCEVKSAPAMNKIPHSQVVAVMRRNGKKAADYARRHNVPRWYTDADALIHDPEVNAIYIATPPDSHAVYTIQAARAGKPVYVEKPMARTYQECRQMIDACRRAGVPLYVAYYRRTLPHFLKVKELLEEGAIGQVRFVSVQLWQSRAADLVADSEENWRVDPDIAGGGYFYDLASHTLDFLDFCFGPVKAVQGLQTNQAGQYEAEDIVAANILFESGVVGSGLWCFTTSKGAERDQIILVGDRGHLRLSTFGQAYVHLEHDDGWDEPFHFDPPYHIQQYLIEQIVDHLRGVRSEVVSTGETAARTNWVLEQMTAY